jgi:tungstate transport system permease protein
VEPFLPIVELSLAVSLSAAVLAAVAGIPLAALLALARFPGRRALVVAVNALLGLPPVVVGLAMYLLLSNSGPLGFLRLLFTPAAMVLHLLAMSRRPLTTAVLAGFGRTVSEVGAVLIVGGNIAFHTRTMTTAVALETSRGNFSLALSLGLVLIGISVTVSSTVLVLGEGRQ